MAGTRENKFSPPAWATTLLGIVAALALAMGLGWLSGQEAERRNSAPHRHAEAAKAIATRECVDTSPSTQFECIFDRVERSAEVARTEQDLAAQQRAATSALVAALISFLTLLVSAAGVWFVKRTLDATLIAVNDTAAATQAVLESNQLSRELARPWVAITCRFTRCEAFEGKLFIDGELTFKNVGQSAATGFSRYTMCVFNTEENSEKISDFIRQAKGVTGFGEALMPNEELIEPFSFDLDIDENASFEEGGWQYMQVFVVSSAQYRSPTQRPFGSRQTARCFVLMRKDGMLWDSRLRFENPDVLPENLRSDLLDIGTTT